MAKSSLDTPQIKRSGTRTIEVIAPHNAAHVTVTINDETMDTLDDQERKLLESAIEGFCQVLVKVMVHYRTMYKAVKLDAIPLILLLTKIAETIRLIDDTSTYGLRKIEQTIEDHFADQKEEPTN